MISNVSHKHYQEKGRIVDIRKEWAMVLLDNPGEIIPILLSNLTKIMKK